MMFPIIFARTYFQTVIAGKLDKAVIKNIFSSSIRHDDQNSGATRNPVNDTRIPFHINEIAGRVLKRSCRDQDRVNLPAMTG
jgi:hypothetical protein